MPFLSFLFQVSRRRAGVAGRAWVLLGSLLLGAAGPPTPAPLALPPVVLPFGPVRFRVAEVVDERPDRTAVAWVLPTTAKPGLAPAAQPLDLQGGAAGALRQFFQKSLPQSTGRPIVVRIRGCRFTETPGAAGTVEGRLALDLAFDWPHDGQTTRLTTYHGGARYRRAAGQLTALTPTLQQTLAASLRYFHDWLGQATLHDVRLARAVQPVFHDDLRRTEPDTLFYDPARPLRWDDFTGRPRPGNYAAAVFPSFAYQGRPRVVNGVVVLDLTVQVFVVRSSSWVGQRLPANLSHEQRHFDIVKLVAERFKRKAHPDSLTVDDYNSLLQLAYLKSFQEMNRLQDQYDAETRHGLDLVAQHRWNQRLDAELRAFGIGPPAP